MKIKTSELTGAALDWSVAKCEEIALVDMCFFTKDPDDEQVLYTPSTDWSQGGPIIEREEIAVQPVYSEGNLCAWNAAGHDLEYDENGEFIEGSDHNSYGPTPLIAAMRCYVASVMGEEIEVPDELINTQQGVQQ